MLHHEKLGFEEVGESPDQLFERYLKMNPGGTREVFEKQRAEILTRRNSDASKIYAVGGIFMREQKLTDDEIREMNEQNNL
jgi:hypothetical protein